MRNDLKRPLFLACIALLTLSMACAPEALSEDPDGNVDPSDDMSGGVTPDMNGAGTPDMNGGGMPDMNGGGMPDLTSGDMGGGDMGGGGLMNPFALDDAAAISAGQAIYGMTGMAGSGCYSCHGETGMGSSSFPPLTSTATSEDETLFNIIKNGQNIMPAYGSSLSDDQIWQVITYIQATFGS